MIYGPEGERVFKCIDKKPEDAVLAAVSRNALPAMIRDLREAKEKLHLFEYAVDAAKNGGAFTADGWTMINSELHLDLLVAKEQVEGAEELLREVEWALWGSRGSRFCPLCLAKEADGHREGCRLKAWLERTPRGSGGGEG
jgi:hypothetical protein